MDEAVARLANLWYWLTVIGIGVGVLYVVAALIGLWLGRKH